jgi:hypothetical protein
MWQLPAISGNSPSSCLLFRQGINVETIFLYSRGNPTYTYLSQHLFVCKKFFGAKETSIFFIIFYNLGPKKKETNEGNRDLASYDEIISLWGGEITVATARHDFSASSLKKRKNCCFFMTNFKTFLVDVSTIDCYRFEIILMTVYPK